MSGRRSLRQPLTTIPSHSGQDHCRCRSEGVACGQADLFAQDDAERNELSDAQRSRIRSRLEATLAKLEATASFPWHDPLDAVHAENRFQYDAEMLGEEGVPLWSRFDREMDRLHATQPSPDARATEPTH